MRTVPREELLVRAIEARERADTIIVPPWPRLLADDVTPEALGSLLAEQGGKIAILSDEGGFFEILAGRYTDGRVNADIYLKGWSGELIMVDRQGRPSERVDDPAISLGITAQPAVVAGLARVRGFRERGVIPRHLFSMPPSLVGTRDMEPEEIRDDVLQCYQDNLLSIATRHLNWEQGPRELTPDTGAYRRLVEFRKWLEPQLLPTGQLGHIREWGNKLAGQAVRIAGLLHEAWHPSEIPPSEFSEETMEGALSIARYLIPHALAAFDLMGADQVVDDARHILEWLKRGQIEKFTGRDAFQALKGTFKKMTRMNEALEVLVEHHYLQKVSSRRKQGAGRPPSPLFWVNPWVYEPS
jgi:hypothetical protein